MANRRVLKYDRCCKVCGVTPIYGSKYCEGCAARKEYQKPSKPHGWHEGRARQCDHCGAQYEARHPTSRYCSRACQCMASKARRASQPPTHTCKGCGQAYTPRRPGATAYCSRECYFADIQAARGAPFRAVSFPNCSECGAVFTCRTNAVVCSPDCREARARRKAREKAERDRGVVAPRACKECGDIFTPAYGSKRRAFCSDKCGKRHSRRIRRSRERARLRDAKVEQVDPFAVFQRDGWRCQICGKSTPQARRGSRYTNAPELDHRTPLSLGGDHSYANTQCACRECNQGKSNRAHTGQLPLMA